MYRRLTAISVMLFGSLSLISCTAEDPSPTVEGSVFAKVVASEVERSIHVRPTVDCGETPVSVVDGGIVDCLLTDPNTSATYVARAHIFNPSGSDDYAVSLEVADESTN